MHEGVDQPTRATGDTVLQCGIMWSWLALAYARPPLSWVAAYAGALLPRVSCLSVVDGEHQSKVGQHPSSVNGRSTRTTVEMAWSY